MFGENFTKVVPSRFLWEAGRCYIGMLDLEDRKEVVEYLSDKVGLVTYLKRALDKMKNNIFRT